MKVKYIKPCTFVVNLSVEQVLGPGTIQVKPSDHGGVGIEDAESKGNELWDFDSSWGLWESNSDDELF